MLVTDPVDAFILFIAPDPVDVAYTYKPSKAICAGVATETGENDAGAPV